MGKAGPNVKFSKGWVHRGPGFVLLTGIKVKYYLCISRHGRGPWPQFLALSKATRVRTMLLFAGRASENAVSLQMRGFCKAQDTENGHIYRSSHAVCRVTSAACIRVSFNSMSAEATRHTGLGKNTTHKEMLMNRVLENFDVFIQCVD